MLLHTRTYRGRYKHSLTHVYAHLGFAPSQIYTRSHIHPPHTHIHASAYKLVQRATHLKCSHPAGTYIHTNTETHVSRGGHSSLCTSRQTHKDRKKNMLAHPEALANGHTSTYRHPPTEAHTCRPGQRSTDAHPLTATGQADPSHTGTAGRAPAAHAPSAAGGRALLSERIDRPRARSPLYIPGDGEGRGSLICLNAITPGFIVPAP